MASTGKNAEFTPLSSDLQARLEQIVIPSFELHEASAAEAVAKINQLLKERVQPDPVHVILWDAESPPNGYHEKIPSLIAVPTIPGLDPTSDSSGNPLVTVRLTDIPLDGLLRYLRGEFLCELGQKGATLCLVKGSGKFGPLVKGVYKIPPSLLGPLTPKLPAHAGAMMSLQACGVTFYAGSTVEVTKSGHLVMWNIQEEIDLCDAVLDGQEPTWFERVRWACETQLERIGFKVRVP